MKLTDIDLWVALESIAMVPRNRHDETYTFNKSELTQAILALLKQVEVQSRIDELKYVLPAVQKHPLALNIIEQRTQDLKTLGGSSDEKI